MKNDDHMS